MTPQERVAWCHDKMKEALADYDLDTASNYLELAEQWLSKIGDSNVN